jgi:two-component system, response regulator, stage 0 sporulation protein F
MKKILVIEDEQNIQLLYRTELESAGFSVETCNTASDARQIMIAYAPDLILLDIRIKGDEDGVSFLSKFRESGGSTPVVIITAYDIYQQEFQIWAADAFLLKSSDTRELLKTVHDLLD